MSVFDYFVMTGWLAAGSCILFVIALHLRSRRLKGSYQILRIVAENAKDGVLLQEMDGTILWCNESYAEMLGRPRKFWIGRKPQKYVYPPEICPSDQEIEDFCYDIDDPTFDKFVMRQNQRADGTLFWNQISQSAVKLDTERTVVVTSCRDVTEQVKREEDLARAKGKLEVAVNSDALTGLANRRKLNSFLDACLHNPARLQKPVGVIHIDLDKFKTINDTHGHAAGDAVLLHASAALRRALIETDMAARIGGDEFIVVRPDLNSDEELVDLANKIFKVLTKPFEWNGITLSYSASLGLAVSDNTTTRAEQLIQNADVALYEVKANGRGTFSVFDDELKKKHDSKQGLAEDLSRAITEGSLDFHFQPIVDLSNFRIAGIETLARWTHPEHGVVSPEDFIPLAEEIGLLVELDLSAARAAVAACSRLKKVFRDYPYVSFNASFETLSTPNLQEQLIWQADAFEVPHDRICIEILETVFLGEDAANSNIALQISQLMAAGFRTRLDDFGVGYAGLSHLAQIKVDGIKIDRTLIRTLNTDPTTDAIVRAILGLAQELELDVIAEGVSDVDVVRKLRAYRCNGAQGFGFGRPMPLNKLIAWIDAYQPGSFGKSSRRRSKEKGA